MTFEPLNDISELENLLEQVKIERDEAKFFERLIFIKQSYYLAPYNAFLVAQQRDDAKLVLSEAKWKKKNRTPKREVQPIVILKPFGPVEFVYDIDDTEGAEIPDYSPNLPRGEVIKRMFSWEGYTPSLASLYAILEQNAFEQGFRIDNSPLSILNAARVYKHKDFEILQQTNPRQNYAGYVIELNSKHPAELKIPYLIHELAHVMCKHFDRSIDISEAEFEAEAVAYLFCYRRNFRPKSERYLVQYLQEGWGPSLKSFERILSALKTVESLARIHN